MSGSMLQPGEGERECVWRGDIIITVLHVNSLRASKMKKTFDRIIVTPCALYSQISYAASTGNRMRKPLPTVRLRQPYSLTNTFAFGSLHLVAKQEAGLSVVPFPGLGLSLDPSGG